MKTILILHGITGHAGIHWQQWLHDQLAERGYDVKMPELPETDLPDREDWLKAIKKEVKDIDPKDLIIVGHSLGVASALDFIEQSDSPVLQLISVSGFAKDYGAELNSYFMSKREIDINKVKKNLLNSTVVFGDDDPYVPQKDLNELADLLNTEKIVIENGGHLNTRSGFTEFPLLLELIEKI